MDLSSVITMDPEEARQAADELEEHRKHLTAEEESFLCGYRALASGRPVLKLSEAIAMGGVFEDTEHELPRLAVARPYDLWVYGARNRDGAIRFETISAQGWRLQLPSKTLPYGTKTWYWRRRAMVPPVPIGTRMRLRRRGAGGWRSCLTLFEVGEWAEAPQPPGDPALLRPLGGDLYVVEATWDLTDLERAVLAGARVDGAR